MSKITVQAPAKINLTLDVIGKLDNGFHELKTIMHSVNLFDYLKVEADKTSENIIELAGNSDKIPYNSKNLVWKAAEKFFEYAKINNCRLKVFIEKNIPVEAGMAGGSTDAAGILYALNNLFDKILSEEQINLICASLGSDLNFCLFGGCAVCTSRGEKIRKINSVNTDISIIKPKSFGISAKEAFEEFDKLNLKNISNSSDILEKNIMNGYFDFSLLHNDLEIAMLHKYPILKELKNKINNSIMTGSGPVIYALTNKFDADFDNDDFMVIENLKTIDFGVRKID